MVKINPISDFLNYLKQEKKRRKEGMDGKKKEREGGGGGGGGGGRKRMKGKRVEKIIKGRKLGR